jgi:FkbM family methyltransferase
LYGGIVTKRMTFLLVCKQKKNIDTFEGVIQALLAMGQRVVLTVQEPDAARDARLVAQFAHANFAVVPCPDGSHDDWRRSAQLLRSGRDWAQYSQPAYRDAAKLASRAAERLGREMGAAAGQIAVPPSLPPGAATRVVAAFAQLEQTLPRDPLYDEFLTTLAPDVVVVTPGLHFGTGQADIMKSARALGFPTWMLLFSWDNLSTKGALHVAPDLMFVWNERQRREAMELHQYPGDRVVVAGAPRFDGFFELRSRVSRTAFFEPLALEAARPTLLYLCSSRFIAEDEPTFIRSWLDTIRAAGGPLATCNVLVRPHPDVAFGSDRDWQTVQWPAMPQVTGWVQRPFDDSHALVLRTTYRTQEAFYECLHHATAVVALNTSAELEAGIAGRPVFTVLANDRAADGQAQTLHFNYLLREHGGFVSYAADVSEHVQQLQATLTEPPAGGEIERFVRDFLRPHGDRPVAPLLAQLLVDHAQASPRSQAALSPVDRTSVVLPPPPTSGDAASPEAVRVLRLAEDSAATILATPETKRWRRDGVYQLAPAARAWLESAVRPGDTVYDIGAGVGAYAIFAALHRGGTVVAFEPGFSAFKALCDNIAHNRCESRIVPLPIALAASTGLFELEYARVAGGDQHTLRERPWRALRDEAHATLRQPVCADTLDDVVARHALPPPTAIRLSVRRQPEDVLAGAGRVLALSGLRTVLCTVHGSQVAEAVAGLLQPFGFAADAMVDDGDHGVSVRLTRTASARKGLPALRDRVARTLGRQT